MIIFICLLGCAPSTEITGSWKSDRADEAKVNRILVTSLTSNTDARQTVENDLANQLQKKGYEAIKSINVVPPTFTASKEPDKNLLLDKIKGTDVDAILTVALIDKETDSRYVPGNYAYAPITRYGYYGRFWGYYNNWYPAFQSPGYYTQDKVYYLETNLYDAKTEELLWSAQSETYTPDGLKDFSKEYASIVIDKLRKDGVLK